MKKQDVINEIWRRGEICKLILDSAQKDLEKGIKQNPDKISVVLSSRRIGKTFFALVLAFETCLKTPNAVVKFLAPTRKMVDDITKLIIPIIIKDCPDELKPQQMKSNFEYVFANGSRLQMAGSDNGNAERLRGSFAHLCIVDEAGFCNDLSNTVRSVLMPMTIGTRGKIILLSTPPKDLEHDFLEFVEEADLKGRLLKKTVFESPNLSKEAIDETIKSYKGGVKSIEFRREYLCEIIKDTNYHAIPEFDDDLEKLIVRPWIKPNLFDCYVSMDLGFKDLTGVIFGYYDFKNAKLVIIDEIVMNFQENKNHLSVLIKQINEKEALHFTEPLTGEGITPRKRISDINPMVIKEINVATNGNLAFINPKKDDKQAAMNTLRMMLASEKIIIDPKCVNLIRHLKNVKWSKSMKNTFDRSPDNGHYDLVDALCYLVRGVDYNKNPFPDYYGMDLNNLFIVNKPADGSMDILKTLYKIKPKSGQKKW